MRAFTSLLTALLVVLALSILSAPPTGAGESRGTAPALTADAGQSADAAGCPGKANGGACCATCQDQQAKAAAAAGAAPEQPAKGCPCQERARRLREAAEAARAKPE